MGFKILVWFFISTNVIIREDKFIPGDLVA